MNRYKGTMTKIKSIFDNIDLMEVYIKFYKDDVIPCRIVESSEISSVSLDLIKISLLRDIKSYDISFNDKENIIILFCKNKKDFLYQRTDFIIKYNRNKYLKESIKIRETFNIPINKEVYYEFNVNSSNSENILFTIKGVKKNFENVIKIISSEFNILDRFARDYEIKELIEKFYDGKYKCNINFKTLNNDKSSIVINITFINDYEILEFIVSEIFTHDEYLHIKEDLVKLLSI